MQTGDGYVNLSSDQLKEYLEHKQEQDYILVDVREPREYQQGHLPGALLLPLGELAARLSELPPERDIIFY